MTQDDYLCIPQEMLQRMNQMRDSLEVYCIWNIGIDMNVLTAASEETVSRYSIWTNEVNNNLIVRNIL